MSVIEVDLKQLLMRDEEGNARAIKNHTRDVHADGSGVLTVEYTAPLPLVKTQPASSRPFLRGERVDYSS